MWAAGARRAPFTLRGPAGWGRGGPPGTDDFIGGLHARQFPQVVVREVQLPEVDEPPGDDRREGGQAVGGQVQLRDLAGDVDEPVEVHPGQPEMGPLHTKSLGLDKEEVHRGWRGGDSVGLG